MKGLRRQLHLYLVVSTIIYLAALSAVSLEQWTENQCSCGYPAHKDSRQVLGRGGASASVQWWCSVRAQACVTVRGWAAACVDTIDTPAHATGYLPTIYCELGWGEVTYRSGEEERVMAGTGTWASV